LRRHTGCFNVLDVKTISEKAEPACEALLKAVESKREVVYAEPGSDDERYLNYTGSLGATGGPDCMQITLRQNPRKITVLEEFLHGTQWKLGIIRNVGIRKAEVHVKDFMCRQSQCLKLCSNDVEILGELMILEIKRLEAQR
jgi:hypothetical protein